MDFETDIIRHVPNDQVPDLVARLQRNPRYVSHQVIPEGDGLSSIIVVYRPGRTSSKKTKKKTTKKTTTRRR